MYWTTQPLQALGAVGAAGVCVALALLSGTLRRWAAQVRYPLFVKLLLLFIPLLVASTVVVGTWVQDVVEDDLVNEYVRRSANLAWAIVNSLALDDLEQLQSPRDRQSEAYERVYRTVDRLVDTKTVESTPKWIVHKIHDGKFYFGVNIWKGALFEPFIVSAEREMFFDALRDKAPHYGQFTDDQGEWFSYLQPITNRTGAVIYVLELYRPTEEIDRANREARMRMAHVTGITVLVAVVIVLLFSYLFTRPVRLLTHATRVVSAGNFDHAIEINTRDEMHTLAQAFNSMTASLKQYTTDLARSTAEQERVQSELRFAREIQQEILPRTFPPYPGAEQVEICAQVLPAQELSGDYFDFFLINAEHIGVVVGDISGKGVAAGLFMMRVRTLLRDIAAADLGAAETLARVNRQIAPDNPSMMFATVLYFVCNMRTGRVVLCNAGHCPPVLLSRGAAHLLAADDLGHGPAIGLDEHGAYTDVELLLNAGDTLVLYTDGVTEATSAAGDMYGEERLLACLQAQVAQTNSGICDAVLVEVDAFQRDVKQFDDVTLLFFKRLLL